MRFPGFYGNDRLKARLSSAGAGGGFSHCYILSGPAGSGKKTLAKCLAAAMECTGAGEKPCGACPNCHKIFGGGHPDVITVDPDTATVPIRVIREMQADAYIRPNEGRKKIYLIPRAKDMQPPAQNALLKLLEEPPEYCVFLLMTDNPEKLLSTVRSRAVELQLFPLSDQVLAQALKDLAPQADPAARAAAAEKSGGYLGAALDLLDQKETQEDAQLAALTDAIAGGDELSLLNALIPLEKMKRPELLRLLQSLHQVLVRAMAKGAGATGLYSPQAEALAEKRDGPALYAADAAVAHAIAMLNANGSAGHAVGCLLSRLG